jgi:hypothetical protein
VTDGLRSVEVRSQVQPEIPLDYGTDPRRRLGRREVIGRGSRSIRPAGARSIWPTLNNKT